MIMTEPKRYVPVAIPIDSLDYLGGCFERVLDVICEFHYIPSFVLRKYAVVQGILWIYPLAGLIKRKVSVVAN